MGFGVRRREREDVRKNSPDPPSGKGGGDPASIQTDPSPVRVYADVVLSDKGARLAETKSHNLPSPIHPPARDPLSNPFRPGCPGIGCHHRDYERDYEVADYEMAVGNSLIGEKATRAWQILNRGF